ncbi:hypothetical protein NC652_035367 [Populus alba x Populus x berolinensis]|nr:hypothetical protein NC652_035367 [Populus alba x Populus x berolinensis]
MLHLQKKWSPETQYVQTTIPCKALLLLYNFQKEEPRNTDGNAIHLLIDGFSIYEASKRCKKPVGGPFEDD